MVQAPPPPGCQGDVPRERGLSRYLTDLNPAWIKQVEARFLMEQTSCGLVFVGENKMRDSMRQSAQRLPELVARRLIFCPASSLTAVSAKQGMFVMI